MLRVFYRTLTDWLNNISDQRGFSLGPETLVQEIITVRNSTTPFMFEKS